MKSKVSLRNFLAPIILASALVSPTHAATLIGFEAESGTIPFSTTAFVGWRLETDVNALGGQSIYAEYQNYGAPTLPANADGVVSYNVTFDTAGNYDLYARLSKPSTNSDTMYFDSTFGTADNWNQYSMSTGLSDNTYHWLKIRSYTVAAPGTLQLNIAARERQLRIDAFAFGTVGDTFTDAQLSAAVVPEPSASLLGALGLLLLLRRKR